MVVINQLIKKALVFSVIMLMIIMGATSNLGLKSWAVGSFTLERKDGYDKIDDWPGGESIDSFTYTNEEGYTVTKVVIKAGQNEFVYEKDGVTGPSYYTVSFSGSSATVSENWTTVTKTNEMKDISHVNFYYDSDCEDT